MKLLLLHPTYTLSLLLRPLAGVIAADTNAWKSRTIYFALTDRIARGDNDNGGASCGDLGDYCGGTFRGLESKLDYIKGMGFDALWISPVVANSDGGYHGYWAQDLNSINCHYGSVDDLKSLVNTAHSKDIYVMVDVVANHMAPSPISNHSPSPLNQDSSYHPPCDIDYSNQSSIENCRIANLPDINTQDPNIRALFRTWVNRLVRTYNFDGVRIDTVKHVEKDYWPAFIAATGVYCIGEVFHGDPDYLSPYANLMPGLLNYPMYYPMTRFYLQQGSSQAIATMHDQISSLFPDPSALGTFIDNHDTARFLNTTNDMPLLKNALAYNILARGIPIVYYGTEQAFSGGRDPSNREDLWRSGFNTKSDVYSAISRLIAAKRAAGGLADDDHEHLYVADAAYAWSRAGGRLIALTTNRGQGSCARYCFETGVVKGLWRDVFGCGDVYMADEDGRVCVNVSNGEPVVLLALYE